jgi:Asp-tRNA(Asn)/Glu-tRNA(Gln) amidotransferase A subunit family amidase
LGLRLRVEESARAIAALNPERKAVLHVIDKPTGLASAQGPLAGVPYVLKDTWDTAGIVTTGGSYRHRHRVPSVSAPVYTALQAQGAVLMGKSNLCDLAFSAESNNHILGPVQNPLDPTRTAGGSTGGGACAVASGMAAFDWGTDFGGSIRSPAAFCGIVGLRLSAGAFPVDNDHFPRIAPMFWPMCGMGPLTANVEDARTLVTALGSLRRPEAPRPQMDPAQVALYVPDPLHAGRWPDFDADTMRLLAAAGIRGYVARDLPDPGKVNRIFDGYLCSHFEEFQSSGELSLPEGIASVFLGLGSLGRLDKRVHPNTAVLFAGLVLGRLTVFRNRRRWDDRRRRLTERVRDVWARGHLILTPTCTYLPPKHGRAAFRHGLQSFTKLGNLVDATGLTLPFGTFRGTMLPRGLQILGPVGSEDAVLDLAARLESVIAAST